MFSSKSTTSIRAMMQATPRNITSSTPLFSQVINVQARGMATEQQLKSRLKSVANIGKITKAMKMVAASKLRQVERLLAGVRSLQVSLNSIGTETEVRPEKRPVNEMVVAITSDRGLCGGVNSAVAKLAKQHVISANKEGRKASLFLIGEKAKAALDRQYSEYIVTALSDLGKTRPVTFAEASLIAEHVISNPYNEVTFIFNKFQSAIAYHTTPLPGASLQTFSEGKDWDKYNFEGEKSEVLQNLYEFRTAVRLYHMFVEAATSEQSARMAAMDNSSKNASEMLASLRLQYNRRRQAKITTELIEIISGAAAAEALSAK